MFSVVCTREGGLKAELIRQLAREPKLSARDLHARVVRDYSYGVTYQYVHKALSQLRRQSVLEKSGRSYAVSGEWLHEASGFLDEVGDAHAYGRLGSVLELEEFGSFESKSSGVLCEPYLWVLKQAAKIRKASGRLDAACFQRRAWPLVVLDGRMMGLFSSVFRDGEQYALVSHDGVMDAYFSRLWQESGFKTKIGVRAVSKVSDLFVCGDFVFQLVHSAGTRKAWDTFYDVLAEEDSRGLWLAHKLACRTQASCRMVVTRNAEFACQLRLKAKALYGDAVDFDGATPR
ncbi:hypothetical protein HYV43_04875 [Candidatus Micrarchaeota archaeon]|nr:hypothetical protein [Candidatus Micrarchaeota archaeon]